MAALVSFKDRPRGWGRHESAGRLRVESGVVTDLPAAVLWDMDGTIIDTEPYWMDAETALVESYGGSWNHEHALTLVGQGLWFSARVLQSRGVTLSEDCLLYTI